MSPVGSGGASPPPSAVNPRPSDATPQIELASDPKVEPLNPLAADAGSPDAGLQEPDGDESDPLDPTSGDPPAPVDGPSETDAPDAGDSASVEAPPSDEPPSDEPPSVEPPVTDPPLIDPPDPAPPIIDPPATDPPPAEPPQEPVPSFEADVWPIFMAGCGTCHTTLRRGGHSVGSPTLATALADARRLGGTLSERLDGGGMPPACSGSPGDVGCISVTDLATIRLWVGTGMAP